MEKKAITTKGCIMLEIQGYKVDEDGIYVNVLIDSEFEYHHQWNPRICAHMLRAMGRIERFKGSGSNMVMLVIFKKKLIAANGKLQSRVKGRKTFTWRQFSSRFTFTDETIERMVYMFVNWQYETM